MAISVDTIPSSTRTYSGVINSVLIQTEDGRRFDSSIQYNRIRDHSTDYYHHFQSERPRFAKPFILLGLAIFVAVWLFFESNRFAFFPLTVSSHKFGKPTVENNDDRIESFYESESTDEIDALNGDDDLQSDSETDEEQTTVEDHNLNGTSTDDDDVLGGEDDNFEGDESKMQSKGEGNDNVSATNFTNTSAATTTIETRVNATKYNL